MIDRLKELYGDRYRVQRSPEDGTYYINCPSKKAEIYLHSDTEVAVHFTRTHRPGQTAETLLAKIPSARLLQAGDFEAVLVCPLADAEALFAFCHARRRRQVSERQRQDGAARLAAFQLQKRRAVVDGQEALESTI